MDWHFSCTRLCSGRQRESDQALFLEITSRFPRLPRRYVCSNLAKHLGVPQQLRLKSKKGTLLLVVAPWSDSTAEQKLKMCLLVHFQHHVKNSGTLSRESLPCPPLVKSCFCQQYPRWKGTTSPYWRFKISKLFLWTLFSCTLKIWNWRYWQYHHLQNSTHVDRWIRNFRDQGMSEIGYSKIWWLIKHGLPEISIYT